MGDRKDKQEGIEEQIKKILSGTGASFIMTPFSTPKGEQEPPSDDKLLSSKKRLDAIRDFHLKPKEISEYLDRFVVRQDDAKKVLSVAICDHYNHVRRCIEKPEVADQDYAKHNIILLGPTGVGKTYLVRCIARLVGVPFVKADATKFSETGYVGHDVEDLVRDLVKAADGDVELAQYGIVFLDEIDKIAATTMHGRDVSGRGVQVNLLKLMEETEVGLLSQTDIMGQMQAVMNMQKGKGPERTTINTRHILFIVSGAFDKLSDQVQKRLKSGNIGFREHTADSQDCASTLRQARTADFIEYGFEPEFVGRLPVRIVCDPLSENDLENILLHSEGSILRQYKSDFEGYGIKFNVEAKAVSSISKLAFKEGTGARGLMTVLERICRGYKFELPSTDISELTITSDAVENTEKDLARLLKRAKPSVSSEMRKDLTLFCSRFATAHGIKITFTAGAEQLILSRCSEDKITPTRYAELHFKDLEYALKLVSRNLNKNSFTLSVNFVRKPEKELSKMVAESFKPTVAPSQK